MVKQINNKEELEEVYQLAEDKLVVIDFFATWCGPCKTIAPKLEAIAEELADKLVVVKIDIDGADVQDLVTGHKIEVMPTFVFKRRGVHLDTLSGSNEAKLKELIEKHIK